MNVKIIATKSCSHSLSLQQELRDMGIPFEVLFVEDEPDVVMAHAIRHSPNLLVNDEVVFRGQPTPHELREFFSKLSH
ncbi:MAG: thioredoxin family protein [Thiobacillus sp.]|nr:thioredoxin family protein [Thiobacillus sp.]